MPLDFNSLVEKQEPSKEIDFNSLVEDPLKKKSTPSVSSATPSKLPSQDKFKQGLEFAQQGFKMPSAAVQQQQKEQGWLMNTVSALDKGFYKNLVGSPVKGLGTLLQGTTAKVMGGTGEGFVSDALIKFGDYFNKTIDELTPQDEEYKNTLSNKVAEALGQVGSMVLTGGIAGMGQKGASLASQLPKAAAVPSGTAALNAAKGLGKDLINPVSVSAGLAMGQSEFDRAKEFGATDDEAFEAFYKNAAVGSVLEQIPVMQFLKRFNTSTAGGVANYIKTKGMAGISGGLEELTTEVLQQLYANKTAKDIYNINQDIFEGVAESGGIGFGVGFLLNALGASAKIMKKEGRKEDAKVVEDQMKSFESKMEADSKFQENEDITQFPYTLKAKKPSVIMPEENVAPEVISPTIPATAPAVIMPEENIPAETTTISPDQKLAAPAVIMPEANVAPDFVDLIQTEEEVKPTEVIPEIKTKLEAFKEKFAPQPKEVTVSGAKAAETRRINQEAAKIVPMEEQSAVLAWLSGKDNQLDWKSINQAAGKVEGPSLNVGRDFGTEEVKVRDYAAKDRNSGESLDDVVHRIWQDVSKRNPNVKIEKVQEALLIAIRENPTRAEAAKNLVSTFGAETKPVSIEEGMEEYSRRKGEEPVTAEAPIEFEGGFVPFEEEGDFEEAPFAVQEGASPEVQEMQGIVKDYIDNGVTALPDIKKAIAKELGYNTRLLRQTIDDAYNRYTTTIEAAPQEINVGLLGRVNNAFVKMFAKEAQKPFIAKDGAALMSKAQNVAETGGRLSFQATLPNGEVVTAKPIDASIVNGFYSPLELQINQMKQDKMPAKQWLDKLRGEEAKWTGLSDWLSQQQGSLTKEEIKNWLQDNQIEINEIVKGKSEGLTKEQNERLKILEKLDAEYPTGEMDDIEAGSYDEYLTLLNIRDKSTSKDLLDLQEKSERLARSAQQRGDQKLADKYWEDSHRYTKRNEVLELSMEGEGGILNPTKFSMYQLEGDSKDYTEILITKPNKEFDIMGGRDYYKSLGYTEEQYWKLDQEERDRITDEWSKVGKYEILAKKLFNDNYVKLRQSEQGKVREEFKKLDDQREYKKYGHFDEANILVHVRMNTRIDNNKNKILFLEEVQSDWGQDARKLGTDEELPILEKKLKDLGYVIKDDKVYSESYVDNNQILIRKYPNDLVGEARILASRYENTVPSAPFISNTNDWTKLGLKVALKEAVNIGADKISWTTGEQQVGRYEQNIRKQVDKIESKRYDAVDRVEIVAYKNGEVVFEGLIPTDDTKVYLYGKDVGLEDIVGKDMAQKIKSGDNNQTFEGDSLTIGGAGMKGFYGSPSENNLGIIGNIAKKLFKQEPSTIKLSLIDEDIQHNKINRNRKWLSEYNNELDFLGNKEKAIYENNKGERYELVKSEVLEKIDKIKNKIISMEKELKAKKASIQYSIDVTPELKAQAQQGLPMFMANPSGADILGFSFANRMYLNGEKLNPNTIIHEAGHIWTEWAKNNEYEMYAKGLELVEKSPYLQKAKNSKFYQEQAAKLTTEQEKEEYFKHEALAMAIGDKGAQFVVESKKESFKNWLNALWSKIKNLTGFSDLTAEEFQNLTFEEFTKMAVKEILGVENALDKLNSMKSFRSKKNFVKSNLKYESNKKAIDELDFTEEDLVKIVKANFDLSTFKTIKDAVQKRSAKKVLQRPQGGVGERRGERKRVEPRVEGEEITREGEEAQPEGVAQIPDEIENVGLDNGDVDYVGITEADINALRKSLGLPKYQGLPMETHDMLRDIAQKMIKEGVTVQSLYDKIRRGDNLTNYENAFMAEYRAALDLELSKNPSKELLDQVKEFTDTFQVGASLTGKALESLKIMKKLNEANTLSNFLLGRQEDKGFPLTAKMIVEETNKFEKLQKAKEELQESSNNDVLNTIKNEVKKEPKKSSEEYAKERKQALADAREALRKLRSGEEGLMVSLPGLNELVAVAPHMNKYVKSLLSEGVSKLDDIVTEVHKEFSELIDGLTKRDVLDVISGKYTTKTRTVNEINAGLRLLRREANLMLELEKARKNEEEAKSESQMAKSSARIQQLENKIKEVRELNRAKQVSEEGFAERNEGKTDKEYNERRQKFLYKKIKGLEDDLKNKNYDKQPTAAPKYKISDRTKKMMDRVVELEKQIALEKLKDQQAKLSKWEKAWDKIQSVLGLRRIIQTSIDASIWFRQLAKLTMNPRKWDIALKFISSGAQSIFSQKNYDRIMYQIHQAPDFKESEADGVKYNELGTPNEMFPKSFLFEIPLLREPFMASQRIADGSINVARYELYNKYKRELLKQGITRESDPEMYKAVGKVVMNSTGSGNMLKFLESKEGQKVMGGLFYGAKLMASNFNTLNPAYYVKLPKEVRNAVMKDLASYTATVMSVVLALVAAGGKVSLDPEDPDFLQVRFGKKVYDFTAGQAAYIRTFLRWVNAGYNVATKSKFEAKEKASFAWNSTLNFFRNKLAPNNAYVVNALVGKNAIGEDFDPMEIFHIYPMYADDAYQAAKEDGFISLLTVLMPNILGVGYSSYYADKAMKPMDEIINRAQDSDEMNPETIRKDITKDEFKEFAKLRDKLIEEKIKDLYKEGIFDEETGEQIPINKSTTEQVSKAISKIKREATNEAKSEFNADEED